MSKSIPIDGDEQLTPVEHAFLNNYQTNGFNAARAYLAVKPNIKISTAWSNGWKLLKSTRVAEALKGRMDKETVLTLASREYLVQEAHDLTQLCKDKREYGNALKGVELKGKLNRVYTDATEDSGGYKNLMQTLIMGDVNINTGTPPVVVGEEVESEAIDPENTPIESEG